MSKSGTNSLKGKIIICREIRDCPMCNNKFEVPTTSTKKTCSKECGRKLAGINIGKSLKGRPNMNARKTYEERMGKEKADKLKNQRALAMSKRMKGKKQSKKHIAKKTKAQTGLKRTPEACKNISNALLEPKTNEKLRKNAIKNSQNRCQNTKYKHGWFYSYKNQKYFWYRSSYELRTYNILEKSLFIRNYDAEFISIPYYSDKIHNYIVDLIVTNNYGKKFLIEVKPKTLLNSKINIIKFKALKDYCLKNNMKYMIWTEDRIFKNQISFHELDCYGVIIHDKSELLYSS